MSCLECCRIVLYVVEWIWTVVVLSMFPSQLLIDNVTLVNNQGTSPACLLNANLGRSRCDFGMAWSSIAFIVISVTIVTYFLEYCSSTIALPSHVETLVFAWLSLWWFVGAIALTVVKSPRAPSPANVPIVFAWMLFILCAISALIARNAPKPYDYRLPDTTDNDQSSRSSR